MRSDYRVIGAQIITLWKCAQSGAHIGAKNVEQAKWRISAMAKPQVKLDIKELKSANKTVRQAAYWAANRAVKETLVTSRKVVNQQAKDDFKLPLKAIRRVFGKRGEQGQRIQIKAGRANRSKVEGSATVILSGIPLDKLKTNQVKGAKAGSKTAGNRRGSTYGGVKAPGGRFYQGAFKTRRGDILKQRKGNKFMSPRIGVRVYLIKAMDKQILSTRARKQFDQRYQLLLQVRLDQLSAKNK